MRRRIVATAALFSLASVATSMLGRLFPASLLGAASALVVMAIGALLIGVAPTAATPQPVLETAPVAKKPAVRSSFEELHPRWTPPQPFLPGEGAPTLN